MTDSPTPQDVAILKVVAEAAGDWTMRSIDYEVSKRGVELRLTLLDELRGLQVKGLIEEVTRESTPTFMSWRITPAGRIMLDELDLDDPIPPRGTR